MVEKFGAVDTGLEVVHRRLVLISVLLRIVVYSRLSRSNTARGSCIGLVTVGPTKVLG